MTNGPIMPNTPDPKLLTTGEVVDFSAYRNRELIQVLEEMLADAKSGQIDGAIMVFRRKLRNHGVVVVGTYEADPSKVCDIAGEIFIHFRKKLPRPMIID